MSYFNPTATPLPRLVADGDSNTGGNIVPLWPDIIPASLPGWEIINRAFSGQSAASAVSTFSTLIAPLLSTVRSHRRVFYEIGSVDIEGGASAATVMSRLESLADLTHAAGGRFSTTTLIPLALLPGGLDTIRIALNALIVANGNGKFDSVAQPTLLTPFLSFSDTSNTTYYDDGTHLTPTGQATITPTFFNAINLL